MFNHILVLVKYPKTQKPIPAFDDTDSTGCPSKYLPDPLFTPEQHLIFEMHAINQHMAKCFDLGPPLVPIYRVKYPDFFGGHFSDFLAKSFGKPGEHLPNMMPLIGSGIQRRIFYLLLAIEATDQCPSVFDKSFDESAKQQSIREQRFRRLACGWIMKVPSAVWDDFGRFSHSTEKYD
ncbi:hypothetical protein FOFC_18892 [Fusarium oxysporum]|nr:hypothetical protein FOFC_18892 [Fusarium oxysporum]